MILPLTPEHLAEIRALADDECASTGELAAAVAALLAEVERQREAIACLERTRTRADILAGRLRVQRDAARQVAHLLAEVTG